MGKKKGQGQKRAFKKDPVATKVAVGVKKTKTKPVVSTLKRMNFQNRTQTEALDAEFEALQQTTKKKTGASSVASAAAAEAKKSADQSDSQKLEKRDMAEEDVAMAADQFEKLSSLTS